jgi:hypothetical protein
VTLDVADGVHDPPEGANCGSDALSLLVHGPKPTQKFGGNPTLAHAVLHVVPL